MHRLRIMRGHEGVGGKDEAHGRMRKTAPWKAQESLSSTVQLAIAQPAKLIGHGDPI